MPQEQQVQPSASITPEERLQALRLGKFSKLRQEIVKKNEEEQKRKKEVEKSLTDRLFDLFTETRARLFAGRELKEAAK